MGAGVGSVTGCSETNESIQRERTKESGTAFQSS